MNNEDVNESIDVDFKMNYLKIPFRIIFFFIKNSRFSMLSYVAKKGFYLRFASDYLKNDKEIVTTAIESGTYAIKYASDDIKNDKEYIDQIAKKHPEILTYLAPDDKKETLSNKLKKHLKSNELKDVKDEVKKIGLTFVKYLIGAIIVMLLVAYSFDYYKQNQFIKEQKIKISSILESLPNTQKFPNKIDGVTIGSNVMEIVEVREIPFSYSLDADKECGIYIAEWGDSNSKFKAWNFGNQITFITQTIDIPRNLKSTVIIDELILKYGEPIRKTEDTLFYTNRESFDDELTIDMFEGQKYIKLSLWTDDSLAQEGKANKCVENFNMKN